MHCACVRTRHPLVQGKCTQPEPAPGLQPSPAQPIRFAAPAVTAAQQRPALKPQPAPPRRPSPREPSPPPRRPGLAAPPPPPPLSGYRARPRPRQVSFLMDPTHPHRLAGGLRRRCGRCGGSSSWQRGNLVRFDSISFHFARIERRGILIPRRGT